jgi:hypothetical protein
MKKRESPFTLRTATLRDLPQCVALAMQIPLENDMEYFPKPDIDKVHETLSELTTNQTLIVYENNGIICGIFGVKIDSFWWSSEPTMVDVIFYIRPEFRSFSAYKRMLRAAEDFAKLNKVPLALLFFTTKDQDKKHQMILRRGFRTVGFWVMKR